MAQPRPVFLFTDFSVSGPYTGQVIAAVMQHDARIPVVDLMHDAPLMRPDLAAYLLPAVCGVLADDAVVVAVVDPGVGSERAALIVDTERGTFVGPDNGLLSRLPSIQAVSVIDWRPLELSASFHGRDLFAPVASRVALGEPLASHPIKTDQMVGGDWPATRHEIIYIDGYGNGVSGIDGKKIREINRITIKGRRIPSAETFSCVPFGELFWYRNSLGLIEVAQNGGSAADVLSLALGDKILVD